MHIKKLLIHNSDLLKYEYSQYNSQNILIVACNDQHFMNGIKSATIEQLIDMGANCTEPTKNDHWEPIHYTALNANKEIMNGIIKKLPPEVLNSLVYCSKHITKKYPFCPDKHVEKTSSNNALHILLKYGNRNEHFYECCELLIQAGIDVHQKDSNGKSPLDIIQKMGDEKLNEILKFGSGNRFFLKNIFELIKLNDETKFLSLGITKNEVNDLDATTEDLSSCTLLQLCCAKGLTSCVDYLLKNGACPNKSIMKNENPPIMIAIKEDHEDICKLLLENRNLILPENILIKLQIKYKNFKNVAKIDKYMTLILQYLKKSDKKTLKNYLLFKDELNRTALHYATQYNSSENILTLLSMGAPLTKKDIFGYTPLDSIEPTLLEKYFDNCINIPKSEEINYESLTVRNEMNEIEEEEVQESEFLGNLVKLKKLSYLMNHPVISSYLAIKWQKFRWVVYINLLQYLIAYISLLFYSFAFTNYSKASNGFLLASLILLLQREFVQMMIFRLDYLKRVENYIDLFLIGGIIYILASGWIQTLLNQNLLVAFSVVFLTSTLGIFIQLGNLPGFTIKVIILRQICINFFKYMVFYMFPVLAFFFCFYMLSEVKDSLFFRTLYHVVTMFAGDPDSSYPEQFTTNPVFSHIIYVVFIVFIGIILQNLLIGLAVSDLVEIQKEAEFIDKKERARYITSIEKIIFRKHKQSSNGIFKKIFRKLLKTCKVFEKNPVLVIQPYNFGCVYVQGNPSRKQYIKDENVVDHLQNILKDLNLKDHKTEERYSLKVIYEKLHRIETLLENCNTPPLKLS
ncbi:Ank 2 and/or Ion trans domain containing protein [Asbolus verrucosus]|uniref:Ank 2 and/or Ion trans domain containing protein n=1 Tax=Asbolus verrucosus TaxID=1661398 RepID=A0A482W818_ASBVE|nr:Ank 2 and/or Ion trans domain containing protein [Asbolus verrucosus]